MRHPHNLVLLSSYSRWNEAIHDAMDRNSDSIDGNQFADMFDTPLFKHDTDDIQAVVPYIDRNWITAQWPLPPGDSNDLDWDMPCTNFPEMPEQRVATEHSISRLGNGCSTPSCPLNPVVRPNSINVATSNSTSDRIMGRRRPKSWLAKGRQYARIALRQEIPRPELRQSLHICVHLRFRVVTIQLGIIGNPKFEMVYLCMFGGLTAFSMIYFTYAQTSHVNVTDNQVSVRCFGLTISTCNKNELATAYKSPIHESVVLQRRDGRKTRISTQFDGLRALVAWLYLCLAML